jgi:hypothetical protein
MKLIVKITSHEKTQQLATILASWNLVELSFYQVFSLSRKLSHELQPSQNGITR